MGWIIYTLFLDDSSYSLYKYMYKQQRLGKFIVKTRQNILNFYDTDLLLNGCMFKFATCRFDQDSRYQGVKAKWFWVLYDNKADRP